jgi:predicted dehydrogenase
MLMKVILAGIGGWGSIWIDAVVQSPGVELAALVEVDDAVIREQVARLDFDPGQVYADLPEALAAVHSDGVILVTPPALHHEMSIIALKAGKPVLCEKPLADSLEAAEEIIRIATERNVLHMVAQDYRYKVAVQTAKRVLKSGVIGDLSLVAVQFFKGPHLNGFRQKLRYPLIQDMAIHHFDLMRFFIEAEPVSVSARSWNPDWSWFENDAAVSADLGFSNGVVASYLGSWVSTGKLTSWTGNWRFEGEYGIVLLENDEVFVQERKRKIEDKGYFEYGNKSIRPIDPVQLPLTGQSYLLEEFRQAVEQGHLPSTICQDNLKSMRLIYNTIASCEQAVRINF